MPSQHSVKPHRAADEADIGGRRREPVERMKLAGGRCQRNEKQQTLESLQRTFDASDASSNDSPNTICVEMPP